jgi:hypothetical protein
VITPATGVPLGVGVDVGAGVALVIGVGVGVGVPIGGGVMLGTVFGVGEGVILGVIVGNGVGVAKAAEEEDPKFSWPAPTLNPPLGVHEIRAKAADDRRQ